MNWRFLLRQGYGSLISTPNFSVSFLDNSSLETSVAVPSNIDALFHKLPTPPFCGPYPSYRVQQRFVPLGLEHY
jgi:hypothetical protein